MLLPCTVLEEAAPLAAELRHPGRERTPYFRGFVGLRRLSAVILGIHRAEPGRDRNPARPILPLGG